MKLSSALLFASAALAATTPSSPITKRDTSPGCGEFGCWSLCNPDNSKPIDGEWNDGDPWCWLWTGDGSKLYDCGSAEACPAPTSVKCLPPQTFTDRGGCGSG